MSAQEFSILGNIDAFLLGMSRAATKFSNEESELSDSVERIAKKLDNEFRAAYDALMPNIHILDAEYTAKLLTRDIIMRPEAYFSNYIDASGVSVKLEGESILSAKSFILKSFTDNVQATIRKKIVQAIASFHKSLSTTGDRSPIELLADAAQKVLFVVDHILSEGPSLPQARLKRLADTGYLFRQEIANIFGNKAILATSLPGVSASENEYVFISKRFTGTAKAINSKIAEALTAALRESTFVKKSFAVSTDISIGQVIHLAHTGIKYGGETLLNSPAYARLIFNTYNDPANRKLSPFSDPLKASKHFKLKTAHVKHAIKVDREVFSRLAPLIRLGITITTDHSAGFNLAMSGPEARIGKGKYRTTQESAKATADIIKARSAISIFDKILTKDPFAGTSSPSIYTLLEQGLAEILKSGTTKAKKFVAKRDSSTSFKVYEPTRASKVRTKPTAKAVVPKSKPLPQLRTVRGQFYSLASLQRLLDANLTQKIKENMGSGNRRDILNLRSGRFAESVRVERMSQSREGMITAFYTYMKNPYQTFEPGFRQGSPSSRNPRLLISKSIREIAATQVANRMRAVLV